MRRILVIGGRIEPAPSANSVCVINVLNELARMGYDCHFLGLGEEQKSYTDNGIYYHLMVIKDRNQSRLSRTMNLFRLANLPETEPEVTKAKIIAAKALYKEYNYDVIIGICSSYSNIYTTIAIKKEYPNLITGGYYLDTLESLSQLNGVLRKVRDHYSYKGENKLFRELDFILLPVASSKIYESENYSVMKRKIVYTEFPTFVPKLTERKNESESDKIVHAIIIGTLNESFRNPAPLFDALKKTCDENGIFLHIDVYGSNEEKLFKTFSGSKFVTYALKGRAPHAEVEKALVDTELLINISNSGILAVPSKIFEYFSSYKPMLTQVTDKDDSSMEYYDKYPACYKYCVFEDEEIQLSELAEFVKKVKNIQVDHDEVDRLFINNTPKYVAEQIRDAMERSANEHIAQGARY